MSDPSGAAKAGATDARRRPLKSRSWQWSRRLASSLASSGITANMVSVAGIVIATAGAAALAATRWIESPLAEAALFACGAACIQLRLLCNMVDGLVAVEGGKGSPVGDVFNEAPDRFEDVVLLVATGYAVVGREWGPVLGWSAATLAVITAYTRALGGSLGVSGLFIGPMAKPHRMAALTVACLLSCAEPFIHGERYALAAGLGIINVGCAATIWRRLSLLCKRLREK